MVGLTGTPEILLQEILYHRKTFIETFVIGTAA